GLSLPGLFLCMGLLTNTARLCSLTATLSLPLALAPPSKHDMARELTRVRADCEGEGEREGIQSAGRDLTRQVERENDRDHLSLSTGMGVYKGCDPHFTVGRLACAIPRSVLMASAATNRTRPDLVERQCLRQISSSLSLQMGEALAKHSLSVTDRETLEREEAEAGAKGGDRQTPVSEAQREREADRVREREREALAKLPLSVKTAYLDVLSLLGTGSATAVHTDSDTPVGVVVQALCACIAVVS
ncbi:hypothetical protein KIPB_013526, partial [Kipferlia bialata]